jgi:hypothetical protein
VVALQEARPKRRPFIAHEAIDNPGGLTAPIDIVVKHNERSRLQARRIRFVVFADRP